MAYASPASHSNGRARTGSRRARYLKVAFGIVTGSAVIALLAFAALIILASFMAACGCGPG
jgi:hypothetical protein